MNPTGCKQITQVQYNRSYSWNLNNGGSCEAISLKGIKLIRIWKDSLHKPCVQATVVPDFQSNTVREYECGILKWNPDYSDQNSFPFPQSNTGFIPDVSNNPFFQTNFPLPWRCEKSEFHCIIKTFRFHDLNYTFFCTFSIMFHLLTNAALYYLRRALFNLTIFFILAVHSQLSLRSL